MSDERRKVLEMLANGKLTAEEADKILDRLGSRRAASGEGGATAGGSAGAGASAATAVTVIDATSSGESVGAGRLRFLRIVINGCEGETVNVRVPLALVRAGIKLTAILPEDAKNKLVEQGVDLSHLSQLDGEALIEALRDLSVDVDGPKGETVRIFCE